MLLRKLLAAESHSARAHHIKHSSKQVTSRSRCELRDTEAKSYFAQVGWPTKNTSVFSTAGDSSVLEVTCSEAQLGLRSVCQEAVMEQVTVCSSYVRYLKDHMETLGAH